MAEKRKMQKDVIRKKTLFEPSSVLFAAIAGIVAITMFLMGYRDHDVLWHTKVGEWVLANKAVPFTDVFSWYGKEISAQYTAHSWLYGVLVFLLHRIFSLDATCCIVVFLGAFSLFLLAKHFLFYGRFSGEFVLAIVIGMMSSNPRPQLFSFCFFFLQLLILQRICEGEDTKLALALFPLGVAWANIHGGMAPVFLGVSLFYACYLVFPKRTLFWMSFHEESEYLPLKERAKQAGMVLACSFPSVFLNPYLARILTYGFLENNGDVKKYVGEWQNGAILTLPGIVTILAIVLFFALYRKNEAPAYKAVPAICCLIAGGIFSRFLMHGVVASFFLLSDVHYTKKRTPWSNHSWGVYLFVVVPAVMTLYFSVFIPMIKEQYEPLTMEEELVSYLKEAGFERIYNPHDTGAKLLYRDIPSYIDSRVTVGEAMVDGIQAERLSFEEISFDEFLKKYRFGAFLLYKKEHSALETYLRALPNWEVSFETEEYVVFVPFD